MNDIYRGTACSIRLRCFVWSLMGFWTMAAGAALLIQREGTIGHTAGYAAVWLLGILGIAAASRPLRRHIERCQEAEGALRETQTRIRETAAHIPGVVYQFVMRPDETYTFPYVSEGVTRILGMTPEQVTRAFDPFFTSPLLSELDIALPAPIDARIDNTSITTESIISISSFSFLLCFSFVMSS